jgi:uncharacterized damage-inducible protein DinB
MITPAYIRTMAAYNAELNRRLYAAAGRLSDAERRKDRGAFWKSIHGTLCHLLWADRTWMSRFAGGEKPPGALKDSDQLIEAFEVLRLAREDADDALIVWAAKVDADWLDGTISWHSGVLGGDVTADKGLLLVHMFNHQTHHRGQVHAMLTAAGEKTGDTDLFAVVRDPL